MKLKTYFFILFAFVVLCSCNKNDEVFSEISENLIKSVISSDGKIISSIFIIKINL